MKTQLTSFGSTARHLVGRCFSYPPEAESHSFFFIDQRVEPSLEAKLHRHAARELYYIVQRDDLFAVRHAIPLEYGPRAAEALAKSSIRNLLYGRFQRPAAFRAGVYEKYRDAAVAIPEKLQQNEN